MDRIIEPTTIEIIKNDSSDTNPSLIEVSSVTDSSHTSYESLESRSDEKQDIAQNVQPLQHDLTVVGLFARAPIPRKNLLPDNYTFKDLKKDQFMPRRRLKTKPIYEEISKDNSVGVLDEVEYDEAMFVPVQGLLNNEFWHTNMRNRKGLFEDRAILFQAVEHYEQLSKEPQLSSCIDDYLNTPSFGEQVIVQGYDTTQIAIGDVFEVFDGLSSLVVEVTSPRKPCFYLDKRNDTSMGKNGMKRYCLTHGLGGWFSRVLVAGELRDGMKLTRTKHPNPKWTLSYISKVLYGENINSINFALCRPDWNRSKEELTELTNLPQLGEFEWREDAQNLMKEMEQTEETQRSFCRSILSFLKRDNPNPHITLCVKGVYGREDIPRENLLPEKYTIKDLAKDQFMPRYKYSLKPLNESAKDDDDSEYDYAMFSPHRGLEGKWEKFWHNDFKRNGVVRGDRAILFQAVEHYERLCKEPRFESCFDNDNYDYISSPTFGEQVIVEGCDSSQLSVGDVFEVEGGLSTLIIEISAPRKPGESIDRRHGTMGENGVRRFCLTNALAGWFTRVLKPGELRDGMTLVRTKHPNPKFTLTYLSKVLYGEGDSEAMLEYEGQWTRSKNELVELISLPQLGGDGWKEAAERLLSDMEQIYI